MTKKIPKDCMPKCESCAFFECKPKDDLGICRRYPPTIIPIDEDCDSVLPVTARADWCGEFIRKTN